MSDNTKKTSGTHKPVRVIGNTIYVSGTTSRQADNTIAGVDIDANGKRVPNIEKQTELVLETINERLKTVGASLDNVIDALTFLVDIKDLAGFNKVYKKYFNKEVGPTRTTVAVHQLPDPDIIVEMKVVAYKE